MTVRKFWRYES